MSFRLKTLLGAAAREDRLRGVLETSEARFRALVENSADAIAVFSPEGIITYATPANTRILGYPVEQFVGRSVLALTRPEDREEIAARLRAAVGQPGTPVAAAAWVLHRDRSWRFLEGTLTSLLQNPAVGGIVCNYRDATESRRASEALRVSEQRLTQALAAARAGAWEWEIATGANVWSEAAYRQMGFEPGDIEPSQEAWLACLHPEDREAVLAEVRRAVASGTEARAEFRVVWPDGSVHWLEDVGQLIFDETGAPVRMYGVQREITDRKLAETALRESEERLRLTLEGTTDGLWDWNIGTGEAYYSPRWYTMLGYQPGELPATIETWRQLLHPEDTPAVEQLLSEHLTQRLPGWAIELRLRARDGSWRWVLSRGKVVEWGADGRAARLTGTHTDVTGHRRDAETLARFTRVLVTLNQVNQAVFRASGQAALFDAVCHALVDFGEFRLAWIGWHDPETLRILPVAHAGEGAEYLSRVIIHSDDRPSGRGPTGTAFRTGRGVVANDFLADPRTQPWHGAAASVGYRASAAFPIRVAGVVRGTLNIYAGTSDFFQQAETQLLEEVAANISLALDKFAAEARRHTAEAALRESEEKYRLLVENQADLLVKLDPEGRILFASPSYCQAFGKTEAELLGQRFLPLARPGDEGAVAPATEDLWRPPHAACVEQHALTRDGWRWLAWVHRAVLDASGKVAAIVGVGRDVTERRHAEQALLEEKERAQVTLHSIGDAVITTDAKGMVQYLNPIAEGLTGWEVGEARGRPLAQVFTIVNGDTRQPAPDPVQRCLTEGKITGLAGHTCLISRSGQEFAIQDSAAPIRGPDGQVFGTVLVFSDVTSSRQLVQAISYQATHDGLTGLLNRQEFERRLQRALAASREDGSEHALGYLDLDQFKVVNDTCGHVAGDDLLRQVAGLLQGRLRKGDTLPRLGGDEFGFLVEHCTAEDAVRVGETLREAVEDFRFLWDGKVFSIGVSIGLVPITAASADRASVLSGADAACYIAKEQGRNRVHLYQADDAALVRRHGEMQWAAQIPRALDEGRLRLWHQRIAPLDPSGDPGAHFEFLLRLEDESGRLVPPGAFLPAAERYNLATRLDRWVVGAALDWLAGCRDQQERLSLCAINLSGHSLGDPGFLSFVLQELESTPIPPEKICFEITETVAIANLSNATRFIGALKDRGCQFSLDDFGSGLSSFAYLKNLPVDYLKIDGAFVKDIAQEPTSFAIVKAMHDIGRVMGKRTIAEFVENEGIVECLRRIGVDYAQGYHIGRPEPLPMNGSTGRCNRPRPAATGR